MARPLSPASPPEHAIAFYEHDDRLVEDVTAYALEGLKADEAVLILATADHCAALSSGLTGKGQDVERAVRDGRLFFEDVAQTLSFLTVDGVLAVARFDQLLDRLSAWAGQRRLRAYGELVGVLWQAGSRAQALRLEELWTQAVASREFSLLCGCSLDGFGTAEASEGFRQICQQHGKVQPATRFGPSEAENLRAIAALEQRALALQTEVSRSKTLSDDLEHASRRKDEFLAMLAHELRNPIAALSVGLALRDKREAAPDPTLERVRESCRRQVHNLAHLVDDLLDVSRFGTGDAELRLRKSAVDLASVVQNAVFSSRAMFEARSHALSVSVAPGPFTLDADPTRLEQIVTNLLHNANKFTEPGGHLALKLWREPGWAVIELSDDGIGIPAEMLERVFDRFTQVNPSLDRTSGGLGLGLTLARQLARLHGGELTARSAGLGKGSTFTLRLPLPVETAVETAAVPAAAAGRRRVLLIEDNEDIRDSLRDLLEDLGHEVEVAVDGPSGLKKLLQMRPDVALVDVGLPGIDGFEVARQARAAQEGRGVYLVALTGYSGLEVRRKAELAGFDRHVIKPLKPEELLTLVHPRPNGLMH